MEILARAIAMFGYWLYYILNKDKRADDLYRLMFWGQLNSWWVEKHVDRDWRHV